MKFILLFIILRILKCEANICCTPEQGVLEDIKNYCVNLITNVTTPTNFKCIDADQFNSAQYNFSIHDGILKLELSEDMVLDLDERDVQGKSIMSFCISLAIGMSILAIMKIMEYSNLQLCAARGFFTYFFLLASFFWTNAVSIQILRSVGRPFSSNCAWRPFLWYALYAWGCPAILTTILAIVNYTPGKHQKPGIGLNQLVFW